MGEVREMGGVCAVHGEVWPLWECRLGTVHGMAGALRARCERLLYAASPAASCATSARLRAHAAAGLWCLSVFVRAALALI